MEQTTEEKVERGKRRSALRFEIFATLIAAIIIDRMIRGDMDSATMSALTGFGSTIFLVCLGYAAALRGIDSYANEVVKR